MKERREQVLCATVDSYIQRNEAVGSHSLLNHYPFSCSSATLRQELNSLEKDGFLKHLHTSSGRVPTTKGYRYYVDSVSHQRDLDMSLNASDYMMLNQSISEVMDIVVMLLKNLFSYSVVIWQPGVIQEILKSVYFVVSDINRAMVVVACQSGLKESFFLQLEKDMPHSEYLRLFEVLNRYIKGCAVHNLKEAFSDVMAKMPKYRLVLKSLLKQMDRVFKKRSSSQKLVTAGISNMLALPEFSDGTLVQRVMTVMEENSMLANMMSRFVDEDGCSVLIGDENDVTELHDCSLVMASFKHNYAPAGVMGVLGPKRMCYQDVMPKVEELAGLLSKVMSKGNDINEGVSDI